MLKTGLLFGSFNPVHIGHMAIASYMKEFEGMDNIWFIVSPRNPFKEPGHLATASSRLHMVKLAIEGYSGFEASDIEFDMAVPSYTINTLEKLAVNFPERDFYIIMGTDNVEGIYLWKGGKTLVNEYKFLIYPRLKENRGVTADESPDGRRENAGCNGERGSDGSGGIKGFRNARLTSAPVIDISSTFIRESVAAGRDMRVFLPPRVYDYILKNRIYT